MTHTVKTGLVAFGAVALSLVGFGQAFGYGGGSVIVPPVQFVAPVAGTFTATVNNGSVNTGSHQVTLTLNAPSGTAFMAISNRADFDGASQEPYSLVKTWNLGNGVGLKTVYVKFYDKNGNASPVVTTTIVDTDASAAPAGVQTGTPAPVQSVLGTKVAAIDTLVATLKLGARSLDVTTLQNELKKAGFFPATTPSTGFYGAVTAAAVAKYQASLTTPAVVLGTKVASLGELTAKAKFGTRSLDVTTLQNELKKAGFYPANLAATGYYGPITKAAVEKYLAAQ